MHNFEIRFNFAKHFLNQNYVRVYLGCILQSVNRHFILKNKSIFTFNDTEIDTQRFDQKVNYNYITRFNFCLYPYTPY